MSIKFTFQSHPTTLRGLNPSELTVDDATHFLHSTATLKVFILEIVAKGKGPTFHCPLALFLICCSSLMLFLRNHRVYHLKEHGITRLWWWVISQLTFDRIATHISKSLKSKKIVKDLLQLRLIQSSQSPFSSLVLLVRKPDGSWRLCVDYRALNQVIIKDKYPIRLLMNCWTSYMELQFFHTGTPLRFPSNSS